jgi:hypothetical protein
MGPVLRFLLERTNETRHIVKDLAALPQTAPATEPHAPRLASPSATLTVEAIGATCIYSLFRALARREGYSAAFKRLPDAICE